MKLRIKNEAARSQEGEGVQENLATLDKAVHSRDRSVTPLFAQYGPSIAAESTPSDIAVGYSFLNLGFSGKPAVRLNGIEASGINVNPSWGATLDSSYVRAGRDPESGHRSSVFSAFAGPVFVAAQKHNMRFLIRPLVGMTLVDGSVPVNDVFYRGWQSRFSWAIGAGVERSCPHPMLFASTSIICGPIFWTRPGPWEPRTEFAWVRISCFAFLHDRETPISTEIRISSGL